ncbi:MAG TPA: hypothetical protein DCQ31_10615 [Bacteroidales bacterium]|nr:hypothetical protein [Bacteroidales bacterium]
MLTKDENLQLEYKTLLDQFKAARDEINGLLNSSRQIVNIVLSVLSIFIGISIYAQTKLPVAFLFLSLFLCMITWIQIRYILLVRRLSSYIENTIAARIREIHKELSGNYTAEINPLGWESNPKGQMKTLWKLLLIPVLGSGFGVPFLSAIISVWIFCSLSPEKTSFEILFIGADVAALVYTLTLGVLIEFFNLGIEKNIKPNQ